MDIVYLNDLKQIENLRGWKTTGLTIDEIKNLEQKYNGGQPFPKAYKEYLYLAGKISGISLDTAFGFDWLQETSKKILEEYGQEIKRPYFVIDQLDGCEQFGFFYLDENKEDPLIYNCTPTQVEEGDPLISKYKQGEFTKVVKSLIESAKSWDEIRGQYGESKE